MNAQKRRGTMLGITAIRVMQVRAAESNESRALSVAHAEGTIDGKEFSVVADLEVQSPRQDYHYSDESWKVIEALLNKLTERAFAVESASSVDRVLNPLVASLRAEARAARESAAAHVPYRRKLYRQARKTARWARGVVQGKPTTLEPHLSPIGLVGVQAIRAALVGAILQAHGEASGEVRPSGVRRWFGQRATWHVGALGDVYEEYVERLGGYACAPAPAQPSLGGATANTYADVAYIGRLPKDGTKGHLLEREALRYGLASERFPGGAFVVTDGSGARLNFKWGRSPIASGVSLSICTYKEATRRLLERVGVPVPRGRVFAAAESEKAIEYADRIGYPVVCKPVAGLRGIGVVSNIRSRDELVKALDLYKQSELGNDDLVIEQHVSGSDYRIVVIGGEVVAAVVREPASVVGDGVHTIVDLVAYKNRVRALNPHLRTRRIQFSAAMEYQLSQAGLSYGSVPVPGQHVVLANSANLSQGGDSFEIAHELHPSIRETAVRAVQAVPGLGFCGLDMLIEDHRKPIDEQSATVIELNAHAAIGSAQYPMWGTPTPVARKFFEECAKAYGVELPEEQLDYLSLKLIIRGRVTGVNYRRWFKRRADEFGVSGRIENTGRKEVTALVTGPADAVAALAYLAIQGPRSAVPTSVASTHVEGFDSNGFEIVR